MRKRKTCYICHILNCITLNSCQAQNLSSERKWYFYYLYLDFRSFIFIHYSVHSCQSQFTEITLKTIEFNKKSKNPAEKGIHLYLSSAYLLPAVASLVYSHLMVHLLCSLSKLLMFRGNVTSCEVLGSKH